MNLGNLLSELQRRRVGRVAGYYAVGGWVAIQVVATVFPLLGVADVATKIAVILVILGFPVAIALGWVYDITENGLMRTGPRAPDAEPGKIELRQYGRGLGYFGVGILVALVAFAALSRVREDHTARTAAGIRSLAVLPFEDMSANGDQAYFADGITEELLNRLTQIADLRVPGRTSSFAFRDAALGIEEIGRRLDVEALLEGSVRREGNNVRVTVRLIDARTQGKLWANEYEKEISSIFAIQDEIASDIVNALKLQINPQPAVAAGGEIRADPAAVDAYMKGLDRFNRRTDADLRSALVFFERAVERDPDFGLGFAMIAQVYALLPAYGAFPAFEASSKGQAAAARALELNPNQAEAYAALGQIRQNFEWDFESAERSYRRAILFNNGYATAHQWRAEALLFLGEYDESRTEIEAALDLDPASPAALHVKAYQHITRHEYAAAGRLIDRLLAANPDYPLALISRTTLAILNGEPAPALMQRLAQGDAAFAEALRLVAAARANEADRPNAARAIAALNGRRSASELALWYALAGLNDDAVRTIEAAYSSGADANLPFILLHPAFDGVRERPPFKAILRDLHMVEA